MKYLKIRSIPFHSENIPLICVGITSSTQRKPVFTDRSIGISVPPAPAENLRSDQVGGKNLCPYMVVRLLVRAASLPWAPVRDSYAPLALAYRCVCLHLPGMRVFGHSPGYMRLSCQCVHGSEVSLLVCVARTALAVRGFTCPRLFVPI